MIDAFQDPQHETRWLRDPYGPLLVVLSGLLLRVYSLYVTPLINPDGTLYIQQAKALHYGLYGLTTACFPYLSIYSILIAICHTVIGNWVLSANIVSLFFGTLTLVPLYLLIRRFFDATTSSLALLVFAVMPNFVYYSHLVIRGPVFWFFAVLGMYLFIFQLEKKSRVLLLLSCLFFLVGAWARVEGSLFIIGTALYLAFSKQGDKWRRLLVFLSPVLVISLFVLIYVSFFNPQVFKLVPFKHAMARVNGVIASYRGLRESLGRLHDSMPEGYSPYFFSTVRRFLWLLALGTVVWKILAGFFYPFSVILILGLLGSKELIKKDPRVIYLTVLSVVAFIALYLQTIFNWAMMSRHIALFLFPAFVFVGMGVIKVRGFLARRLAGRQAVAAATLGLAILLVALPKNLQTDYGNDMLALKEMGEFIASQNKTGRDLTVAGSFKRVRLVHFYANENSAGAPCFDEKALLEKGEERDPRLLLQEGFDYYIWNEKYSPVETLQRIRDEFRANFAESGEWWSPKFGRLILFKIVRS